MVNASVCLPFHHLAAENKCVPASQSLHFIVACTFKPTVIHILAQHHNPKRTGKHLGEQFKYQDDDQTKHQIFVIWISLLPKCVK